MRKKKSNSKDKKKLEIEREPNWNLKYNNMDFLLKPRNLRQESNNKMCEDKNALKSSMNTSSNEMNIDKVKELGISFNNINENTPDYDYNINSN